MTNNQLKAKELAQRETQFSRSHAETQRSNKAQEAIGRTNAAANVAKAVFSPFKVKLNHIEWYKHSPTQLEAVAKLPYTKVKGSLLFRDTFLDGDIVTTKGMMIVNYVDTLPVIGGTQGLSSSPVNIIAQNLFSKLRSKVSGSITFEAADYMMYIMSVGSYFSFWSYLCRLYNILNSNMFNDSLYLRSQLIKEMGYDFSDLDGNKLLLLSKINEFGSVLANFAIPSELDYFKRKLWLTSNIFTDHKDVKFGSLYMMNPTHTYRYGDGILEAVPLGGTSSTTLWSLSTLITVIDSVINSMTGNESWIDMSGQTKRAYEGTYFTFPTLRIDSALNVVYDEDVLRQIQSADITVRPLTLTISQITDPDSTDYGSIYQGTPSDGLDFDVVQGFPYTTMYITVNGTPVQECLFSNEDIITEDDVARQTRLKSRCTVGYAAGKQHVHYACVPTELVVGISVLSSNDVVYRFERLVNSLHPWDTLSNKQQSENEIIHLGTQFFIEVIKQAYHFCPILFATTYDNDSTNPSAFDMYYYIPYINNTIITSCSNSALDAINRVCISSMLGLYDNLSK